MDIIKVALIGLAGVFLAVMIKDKGSFSQYVIMGTVILIFTFVISKIEVVISTVTNMEQYVNVDAKYVNILLKMAGITYVSEFASSMCRDNGYSAIASQIELFSRLTILIVSLPVITSLIETIGGL